MATWTRGALGTVFVMGALWMLAELNPTKKPVAPRRTRPWWM